MAYSEIEQYTFDLDLFFRDKTKFIHFASGGGKIPDILAKTDFQNEDFREVVQTLEREYEIEINPNLSDILNINLSEVEDYLTDFRMYASKGFYSYDKTYIGDFEDPIFHLVAKPNKIPNNGNFNFDILMVSRNLPDSFDPFTITDFM